MTVEVAIARLSLRVRGVPERPSSAGAFVEAVLSALERLLDGLPDLPEVVVLPRLSVDVRVAVPAGVAPADAIARALADAIAQAALCAPVPAPGRAAGDRSPAPARVPAARARQLHAAAQAARAGQPPGAVAALLGRATAPLEGRDRRPELHAASPSSALVPGGGWAFAPRWAAAAHASPEVARSSPRALVAAALCAPRPLALLGRLARARLLGCLVEALAMATGAGDTWGAESAGLSSGAGPSPGAASPSAHGSRAPGVAAALSLLRRVVEELADGGGGALPGAPSLCEAAMARIEAARARALRAIAWAGEVLAAPVQLVLALAELSRTGQGALARSRAWRAAVVAAIARHGVEEVGPTDFKASDAIDTAADAGVRAGVPEAEGAAGGTAVSLTPAEAGLEARPGRSAPPAEAAAGGRLPSAPGVDEDQGDAGTGVGAGIATTVSHPAAPGAGRTGSWRAGRASPGIRGGPHAPPVPGVKPHGVEPHGVEPHGVEPPVHGMEPPVHGMEPQARLVTVDGTRPGAVIMAARPLAGLGRLARRGRLPELVGQLDEATARALLGGIHAELLAAGPRLAAQPQAASALRSAEARALHVLVDAGEVGANDGLAVDANHGLAVDANDDPAPGALTRSAAGASGPGAGPAHLPPAVKLVLAFAELCRATPAALLNAPSLRAQALATIEQLVGAAALTPSPAASPPLPASKTASAPSKTASAPSKTASAPSKTASRPRQTASRPRQTASAPRQTASAPRQTASAPRQTASAPQQTASAPQQTASTPPPPPPSDPTPSTSRPPAALAALSAAADPPVPSPLAAPSGVSLVLPDLLPEDAALFSRAAGLAFLVRPLLGLGWAHAIEAIQPEPTFALHAVLRRVLAAELGEEWADDPAAWVLAGLLDAPAPDELEADAASWPPDRCAALARAALAPRAALADAAPHDAAPSHDAACAAWARAAVAQARLQLADFPAGAEDLARDVIAIPGVLRRAEAALEVRLPFTRSYEALLRAGLSFDIARVPWLDEGGLRFVFGEQD
ncbi:hypothetical protein [Sorangium sp. So ce1389]|uniref:hypothetical protein n=1 Tax=Sorangium sp. So ce1389 TaxID=3133336 RepID=UPI003F625B1B